MDDMSRESEVQQGQVDGRTEMTPAELLAATESRSGAVHMVIGAASTCWLGKTSDPADSRQFDTNRALELGDALLEWLALAETGEVSPTSLLGDATSRAEAIGLALGAASTCWSTLSGAGEFDSRRASSIVDALLEWLALEYQEEDLAAPGDSDAVAGLEVFQRAPNQPLDNRAVTLTENGTVTMTVDQWEQIGSPELVQFTLNRNVSPVLAGIETYERRNESDVEGIPVRRSGSRVSVAATHLLRAACGGAGIPAGTRRVPAKVATSRSGVVLTFSPEDERAEIVETVRRPRKPKPPTLAETTVRDGAYLIPDEPKPTTVGRKRPAKAPQ